MNIYKIIKKIIEAASAAFILSRASSQELVYSKAYEIKCPERSLDEKSSDTGFTAWLSATNEYFAGYGLYGENDTAIIGNAEWKLIPYSYSTPNATNLRVGGYQLQGEGPCLFFGNGSGEQPTSFECYYRFAQNPDYKSSEGIDAFGLMTTIRDAVFFPSNANYLYRYGASVYSTNQYKCGGIRRLKYREYAKYCKPTARDACKIASFKPSISDSGLKSMNTSMEALQTCVVEEVKDNTIPPITPDKETHLDTILSKFFNKTRECNCNCNLNINVNQNLTSSLKNSNGKWKKGDNNHNQTNEMVNPNHRTKHKNSNPCTIL